MKLPTGGHDLAHLRAQFSRPAWQTTCPIPTAIIISTPAAIILDAGAALAARDVIDEIR
jgi:hypothetical protein